MHTPELVLFHPYQHSDLCLENKLQKGTAHVKLMILFGTIDSSLDYRKTKGCLQQYHMSATDCGRSFLFFFSLRTRGFMWHSFGNGRAAGVTYMRRVVSLMGCRGYPLQQHHEPPAPPLTLVVPLLILIFSLPVQHFLSLLKHIFPEVHLAQLLGSAVSYDESLVAASGPG